jgi:hypothetical protein
MRAAQRIELSLTKQRVEKLIVCLGYDDGAFAANTRGAITTQLTQRLLQQCQPGPSDVHNPDVTRANARDRQGRSRTFFAVHEQQLRRSRHGRTETLRTPQTWDTSRVVDFMGVWCDRLLLGDDRRPSRCALLEPHVPQLLWGESMARVAQAHRYLTREDVLMVTADESLPFGVVRLGTFEAAAAVGDGKVTSVSLLQGATTVAEAVKLFAAPLQSQSSPSNLQLGIGAERGHRSFLTVEESAFAERLLIPLCTFAAALWAANPMKAAEYVAILTATPQTLTEAQANYRLWRTMQHAMLSTRDTALLRAYFNEEALDARFSPAQTRYFAETLLHRLREEENRQH